MNENLLRKLSAIIFNFSGLQVSESQYFSLNLFLQKEAAKFNTTIENLCEKVEKEIEESANSDACANKTINDAMFVSVTENKIEQRKCEEIFSDLINFITVNETYFFREEKQFDFLKNVVFPEYFGKKINIWSAACATGEEPLSLLALAEECKLKPTVFATDIDKRALQNFTEGKYTDNSFRKDGSKYHNLLQPFFKKDGLFYYFDKDFLNKVRISQYNLISEKNPFPNFYEKMDVIFIRNVFIYFNVETRKKVLKFLASQLKDDGVLLFSVSEVASIDDNIIPAGFEKESSQGVYYIRHKSHDNSKTSEKIGLKTSIPSTEKKKNANPIGIAKRYLQKIRDNNGKKLSENSDSKKTSLKTFMLEKSVSSKNEKKQNAFSMEQVKRIFYNVCDCININDFENAENFTLELKSDQKIYQLYMQGYVAYHNDNKADAERLFASAEMMSKDFWPAYFYHGLVLKDVGNDEKAAFSFKKCLEILDSKQNSSEYDFFIDSFSPSYIYSLCRKFQNE